MIAHDLVDSHDTGCPFLTRSSDPVVYTRTGKLGPTLYDTRCRYHNPQIVTGDLWNSEWQFHQQNHSWYCVPHSPLSTIRAAAAAAAACF